MRQVLDGDTLLLEDGRRVRLIGVNAPELAHGDRPEEPGSRDAMRFTREFLADYQSLRLEPGAERVDRYGRTLAHVYRADGRSLEAALLARGFAQLVAIPPNIAHVDCLARVEAASRQSGTGLWRAVYRPRAASDLNAGDAGFRLVRGRVSGVFRSRSAWWIEVDDNLALRVGAGDQRHFDWALLQRLQGRVIEVRGWLIPRTDRAGVRVGRHPPWLMHLRHPAVISACDGATCRALTR